MVPWFACLCAGACKLARPYRRIRQCYCRAGLKWYRRSLALGKRAAVSLADGLRGSVLCPSRRRRQVAAMADGHRGGRHELSQQDEEELMTMDALAKAHLKLAFLVMGVVLVGTAVAQTAAPAAVALTPVEMKWQSQGGLAASGMEQLNLVGDPAKPGPYTLRLKFPKGFRIAPHTHPDSREVTIVSGTFATGYGETFDAAKLKILPAGSFYTEPANVPHYIEIKEDVILQVSGMGPSGSRFVGSTDRPQ